MTLPTNAIISLADLKTRIGESTTTYDTELEALIGEASDWADTYCNRTFKYAGTPYVEYVDVDVCSQDVYVRNFPINTLTSVYEDPNRSYGSGTLLVNDTDYVYYSSEGRIHRLYSNWQHGPKVLKITYAGGYANLTDVPAALRGAMLDLCKYLWERCSHGLNIGSIASRTNARSDSVSYFQSNGDLPARIKDRFSPFVSRMVHY